MTDHDNPRSPRSIATAVLVAVALWLVVMAAGCGNSHAIESPGEIRPRPPTWSDLNKGKPRWVVWFFAEGGTMQSGGTNCHSREQAIEYAQETLSSPGIWWQEAIVAYGFDEWDTHTIFKSRLRYARAGYVSQLEQLSETIDIANRFASTAIYAKLTMLESATQIAITGAR